MTSCICEYVIFLSNIKVMFVVAWLLLLNTSFLNTYMLEAFPMHDNLNGNESIVKENY